MKFAVPEISWHNRDPVLSVDFQPNVNPGDPLRLATGGTDSHVLIWYISAESGTVNLEVAADLARHQKAVNVVRWSPNGKLLASGDDESIIFVWTQKTDKDPVLTTDNLEEQYKETWVIHKTLRGHMEDVLDISWSADSLNLASGSVDNKLLVWDVSRGRYTTILTDHKGFVQGVAWDPKGQMIASASTDRVFRTFDVTTKKILSRCSKAVLPFSKDHSFHDVKVRLFHDDTLQTFYRRLQFSPDGMLIAVPAGKIEPEQGKLDTKPINAVYIFTRYSLKVPVCVLPCGDSALVSRWSPRQYAVRAEGPEPCFPLRKRMVLAIGTKRSILLYDTQQKTPIALVSNIHYTRLTDLTWSPDGHTLVASSTDGFCSVIMFTQGELGEVLPEEPSDEEKVTEPTEVFTEEAQPVQNEKSPENNKRNTEISHENKSLPKIDKYMKFKTPNDKSPKKRKIDKKVQKTPIKSDVLEDTAMPSWSDNSNSEVLKHKDSMDVDNMDKPKVDPEVMVIEDSEDIKLVYEETMVDKSMEKNESEKSSKIKASPDIEVAKSKKSPKVTTTSVKDFLSKAKVTDIKEPASVSTAASPKAARRVSFITLSSPKNSKKKC